MVLGLLVAAVLVGALGMSFVSSYEEQKAFVARWTAKLDARDALVAEVQAAPGFPAGATLEVVHPRDPGDAGVHDTRAMENRVNDDRSLWQVRIVGTVPREVTPVEDLRDLAAELGLPVPALVAK